MSEREFVITSAHGRARLTFAGEVPRGATDDGYDIHVRLSGGSVEASDRVWDHQPQSWTVFFQDLARHWRGWEGERCIESLEGQLRLTCTADKLGHIFVRVRLRGDMGGSDWRAEDTLQLEAGQLEDLARRASEYFG